MAPNTTANFFSIDQAQEALRGQFKDNAALMLNTLASSGAVVMASNFTPEAGSINKQIIVPQFALAGEVQDLADGVDGTPQNLSSTPSYGTVRRGYLGFELTDWARRLPGSKDPYEEWAQQAAEAVRRRLFAEVVAVAVAAGAPTIDKYNAGTPKTMDSDLIVDGLATFGDRSDDIVAVVTHSKVKADLSKLKTSDGALLLGSANGGIDNMIMGRARYTSDALTVDGGMAAVSATGTTPPTITITGTPNRPVTLRIECTTLGALGTSRIRYSTDGGVTWISNVTTVATVVANDTRLLSASGLTEATGLTINIAAGAMAVDNVWTSANVCRYTSALLARGAIGLWYSGDTMEIEMERKASRHSTIAHLNFYFAAARYVHTPSCDRCGVTLLKTN